MSSLSLVNLPPDPSIKTLIALPLLHTEKHHRIIVTLHLGHSVLELLEISTTLGMLSLSSAIWFLFAVNYRVVLIGLNVGEEASHSN